MGESKNFLVSQDMLPYQAIILKLRHRHNSDKLEGEIKKAASRHDVAASPFLIKMEIKRLASDANKILDFRCYFKELCSRVEIGGVGHYLDERAEQLLRAEYQRYGDRLTVGAAGLVTEDAKRRYRDSAGAHSFVRFPEPVPSSLTRFHVRSEERLFFTKAVKLYYRDPSTLTLAQKEIAAIDGVTTNVSLAGISIRFAKESLVRLDGRVFVHMHELEREFRFNNKPYIPYQIIKSEQKQDHVYLFLRINPDDRSDTTREFERFVDNYVSTQRGKYRISADNVEKAAAVKLNEQYVMSRVDALPVFLGREKGSWSPVAQFFTNNNHHIGRLGKVQDNKSFLVALSKLRYLQKSLDAGTDFCQFLFIFPLDAGTAAVRYLAVPYQALISNRFLLQAARRANSRSDLNLVRVEGAVVDPATQAHVPCALPDSVVEKQGGNTGKPAGRAKEIADKISRVLMLSDLTCAIDLLQLLSTSPSQAETRCSEQELASYVLKIPKTLPKIVDARIESNDFRSEDRFEHKMPLEIRLNESPASTVIQGFTENISTKGMKVTLSAPASFKERDVVVVTLPELHLSAKTRFKSQPYNIVGCDGEREFRLNIHGRARDHSGRALLKQYIHENIESVGKMDSYGKIPGLSRILRNLFAHNTRSNYGIIARKGGTRYIRDILCSENGGFVQLNRDNDDGIADLVKSESFREEVAKQSATINKDNPFVVFHLAVVCRQDESGRTSYLNKTIDNVAAKRDLKAYLAKLSEIGTLKVLRIKVTNKGRVFNKYLEEELMYLSRYASAKAGRLKDKCKETVGIVEISDITGLVTMT